MAKLFFKVLKTLVLTAGIGSFSLFSAQPQAPVTKLQDNDVKSCSSLVTYMQQCISFQYEQANNVETVLDQVGDVFVLENMRDQEKLAKSVEILEVYLKKSKEQEVETKKVLTSLGEIVDKKIASNTSLQPDVVTQFKVSRKKIDASFTKLNKIQNELAVKLKDFLAFMSKGSTSYQVLDKAIVFDDGITASSSNTQFLQDENGTYLYKSYIVDINQLVKTYSDEWQVFINEYYGKKDLFQKIVS